MVIQIEKSSDCAEADLPESMHGKFAVLRGPTNGSVSVAFSDNNRTAIVNLTPLKDFAGIQASDFPDKTDYTHSQLYRQAIANGPTWHVPKLSVIGSVERGTVGMDVTRGSLERVAIQAR